MTVDVTWEQGGPVLGGHQKFRIGYGCELSFVGVHEFVNITWEILNFCASRHMEYAGR